MDKHGVKTVQLMIWPVIMHWLESVYCVHPFDLNFDGFLSVQVLVELLNTELTALHKARANGNKVIKPDKSTSISFALWEMDLCFL